MNLDHIAVPEVRAALEGQPDSDKLQAALAASEDALAADLDDENVSDRSYRIREDALRRADEAWQACDLGSMQAALRFMWAN